MNELVRIMREQAVCTSRDVAANFHKQHFHVLRDIDALQKDISNFGEMFFETTMPDEYGRKQRAFIMNRDGFTLLAMGFTGKKALEWKLKYIAAFNQMERIIVQRQTVEWKDARLLGKQARREETDEIKRLVAYAEAQGSKHADMLYANYSRLVKKSLDMDSRDTADALTLSRAAEMERIVRRAIKTGMENHLGYKDIYKVAKEKVAAYREMVLLPA